MYIITGASKGVGRYLFSKLQEEGIEVFGTYYTTQEGFNNDSDHYFNVNISDYKSIEKWIDSIKGILQNVVLINCAGISYTSFAHKAQIEEWRKVIEVNLTGTFSVIHQILPIMRDQNFGRIINISSVVISYPTPGVSAYAASKSAFSGLVKTLAVENASKGITINNINLGYAEIGMGIEDVPIKYQEMMKSRIPCGRFCPPADIFNTIKYIVNTGYLNGASIDLSGGLI